ncbi:unnamed protein product [Meganyctiphanes norvegica]|uniref:BTB domain-containing protein n=1 Tax=Meganyctiphanes norvegica TaxID=48144 RepID=A0AAV2PJR3_MEGNR
MGEGLLSLKWNNHKPAFASLLKVLRQKGCYTDVTLACGSKFFEVHRLVLMACSEFFTKVFDRITCQKPVIVLNEVKSQELEALLDYMYLGEVDVQQKHLPGLIKAAEYLLIKGLAVPDEDPVQHSKADKSDDGAERPTKRRRPDRDSRESERQSNEPERGNQNVHINQQYSKSSSSDAKVIAEGTTTVNRIPVHQIDEDNEFEVESDNSLSSRLHQDANSSLNRTQQQQEKLHNVENKQKTDSGNISDITTQNRMDSYSHQDIKTEQCDISEIEEIDNSAMKTELDISNDTTGENSSADFSHFLSSNVEENLAPTMFQSPHQDPGPSGMQRHMGNSEKNDMAGKDAFRD